MPQPSKPGSSRSSTCPRGDRGVLRVHHCSQGEGSSEQEESGKAALAAEAQNLPPSMPEGLGKHLLGEGMPGT